MQFSFVKHENSTTIFISMYYKKYNEFISTAKQVVPKMTMATTSCQTEPGLMNLLVWEGTVTRFVQHIVPTIGTHQPKKKRTSKGTKERWLTSSESMDKTRKEKALEREKADRKTAKKAKSKEQEKKRKGKATCEILTAEEEDTDRTEAVQPTRIEKEEKKEESCTSTGVRKQRRRAAAESLALITILCICLLIGMTLIPSKIYFFSIN